MEQITSWLIVLAKLLHLPFIAGLYIKQEKADFSDSDEIGDNLPYLFLGAKYFAK